MDNKQLNSNTVIENYIVIAFSKYSVGTVSQSALIVKLICQGSSQGKKKSQKNENRLGSIHVMVWNYQIFNTNKVNIKWCHACKAGQSSQQRKS